MSTERHPPVWMELPQTQIQYLQEVLRFAQHVTFTQYAISNEWVDTKHTVMTGYCIVLT